MSDQARRPTLKSLPADEQPQEGTGIRPGLHVRMSLRPPVADWLCRCGHHERAVGKAAVSKLTTRARASHCPHIAHETAAPTAEGGPMGAARMGVRSVTDLHLPTTAGTPDRRTAA
ncbi:hypothetical protein BJP40_17305 [Streptomyces sp. CC53]|uniref:hypothetical protein n=1 Tax=Streptomyces sp. CC53 TaxID=1906740 RepID=UPI0008DC67C3|nr:hypothetical protein [Streptomyces sp. CC53]OII65271.1 hypothetical protein BJP40_17305 [Streptomyces sp. CC53]